MASLAGEDLRRVEVEALVELLKPPVQELHALEREMPREVARLEAILVFILFRREALRAEEQHVVAAELEQVRALPHVAELLVLRRDLAARRPVARALVLVDEHGARLVFALRAEHEVAPPVAIEDVGVAVVARVARGIRRQDDLLFRDRPVVPQRAEALRGRAHACRVLRVARVEYAHAPVLDEAAAGVAAVLVMRVARPHRELRHRVVHEVARRRVRPALVLVLAAQRVPLVEDVRDAARVDEPVRVVDEPERHLEVEPIVPAVSEWKRRPHRRVDGPLVDHIHTMPSDILSLEKHPAARCRADASRPSLRLAGELS